MGAADEGPAAERLLRQCAARRDGGGFARFLRRVFRHHGRPGVCVSRCGGQLGTYRPRSAGGAFGRGSDTVVIQVVLPAHLRTLAELRGELTLEVNPPVTLRAIL